MPRFSVIDHGTVIIFTSAPAFQRGTLAWSIAHGAGPVSG